MRSRMCRRVISGKDTVICRFKEFRVELQLSANNSAARSHDPLDLRGSPDNFTKTSGVFAARPASPMALAQIRKLRTLFHIHGLMGRGGMVRREEFYPPRLSTIACVLSHFGPRTNPCTHRHTHTRSDTQSPAEWFVTLMALPLGALLIVWSSSPCSLCHSQ